MEEDKHRLPLLSNTRAPGPGLRLITLRRRMLRDPLGVMRELHREHGDLVRLGVGRIFYLAGHPLLADHVLRKNHANYDRQTPSADAVREVTGESLLTNDGEEWRRHRLMLQPSFTAESVRGITSVVTEETEEMLSRWRDQETVDAAAEMMRLTFRIAGRSFFGSDLGGDAEVVERLLPAVLEETYRRSTALLPIYRLGLRPRDRRFDTAIDRLQSIVRRVITGSTATGADLLSRLLRMRHAGDPGALGDDELSSEMLALMLAGHETTANALAWTLYLVAQSRETLERLRDDAGVEGTPFTSAVFQEALRLYPPVWIVERRACEDDELGGFAIDAGSTIYVSPYILHRHRDFWREPDRFDPERFLSGLPPRSAYIPFGAGPHHCLGAHFAMQEGIMILSAIAQQYDFRLGDGAVVEPKPWITLRPSPGVPLVIRRLK
jgi:cytochrome P450